MLKTSILHLHLRPIAIIAKNELYSLFYQKVFWVPVVLALGFISLSWIFAFMTLGERLRVLSHIGITGIYLCLVFFAIALGSSRLFQEIESKRLSMFLISPVYRSQVLLGHYLGIFLVLFLKLVFLLSLLFILLQQGSFLKPLLAVGLGIYMEVFILFLLASCLSQWLNPWLSAFGAVSFFLNGALGAGFGLFYTKKWRGGFGCLW